MWRAAHRRGATGLGLGRVCAAVCKGAAWRTWEWYGSAGDSGAGRCAMVRIGVSRGRSVVCNAAARAAVGGTAWGRSVTSVWLQGRDVGRVGACRVGLAGRETLVWCARGRVAMARLGPLGDGGVGCTGPPGAGAAWREIRRGRAAGHPEDAEVAASVLHGTHLVNQLVTVFAEETAAGRAVTADAGIAPCP